MSTRRPIAEKLRSLGYVVLDTRPAYFGSTVLVKCSCNRVQWTRPSVLKKYLGRWMCEGCKVDGKTGRHKPSPIAGKGRFRRKGEAASG